MERKITCTGFSLQDHMTVARLDLVEEIASAVGKPKHKHFTHDVNLWDYKQEKVREVRDKEGNLVHQNPVFLSGKIRGTVVIRVSNAVTKELYPGRHPLSVRRSIQAVGKAASLLATSPMDEVLELKKGVESALRLMTRKMTGADYSAESCEFYRTVHAALSAFGRGEETEEEFEDEASDE